MDRKAAVTGVLILVLLLLGTLDTFLIEGIPKKGNAELGMQQPTEPPTSPQAQTPPTTQPPLQQPSKGVGKRTGPNVTEILKANKFELREPKEPSILSKIIPTENKEDISTFVLMKNNDRAGLIAWVESPRVKTYYLILKEALHASFSSEIQDLVDETQRRERRPIRNFLTFLDPGIAAERVAFIRVRQRLYEFHIAEGLEDAVFEVIEELTR